MCTKGGSCSYSHHSPSAEAIARFETQRRAEVADKVARASAATVAAALPVPAWLQQARTQMIFDAAGGDALEAMRCAAAGFLGARLEKFDGLPLPDGTAAADAVATTADPNATAAPTATATPAPTAAAKTAPPPYLNLLHTVIPNSTTPVPICPTLMFAHKHGGHKLPATWKKALMRNKTSIARFHRSLFYQEFLGAFKTFVKDTIAPLCGDTVRANVRGVSAMI